MCCHGMITSGSNPCFSLLSSSSTTTQPHIFPTPSSRISYKPYHSCNLFSKSVFPIRTRFACFKSKAAINGNQFAVEASMSEMSFYDLLGISESVSTIEIKQAYKQLARKYHPDVSPPGQSEEYTKRFIRVQEAYETLSDPRRRAVYDRDMAKGLHLAFSARKRYDSDEGLEDKSAWKNRWHAQVSELKRRSTEKEARGKNMSWGARMRSQRSESSDEL